ncbi:MAG TPA: hypothetical protein VNA24_35800 [Hyalangium sp.]|nr:hypothetical protein [Hyalangium sp.]
MVFSHGHHGLEALMHSGCAEPNRREADRVLDFLFKLQNPPQGQRPVSVVVLAGDIHTPGYSTLYSSDPAHAARSSIPLASEEWHLKVKFYLEGYPEPRILLFGLHRSSDREDIPWPHAREPRLLG